MPAPPRVPYPEESQLRPMSVCVRLCLFAMISCAGASATSVGALTPTPTVEPATTSTPCPGCSRLGYLSVSSPTLDPPLPAVGDTVTFTFSLSYGLPGTIDCTGFGAGGSCRFEDDAFLLDGDEPPSSDGTAVVVRRRVGRAGVTRIQLNVTAMTEDQCYDPDPLFGCRVYFQYAPIEASSPPLVLQLGEANAATPTDTPTPTPTDTPEFPPCPGDCDRDHRVTVDELLTMVNIALGKTNVATCLAGDANHDNAITIGDIVTAVNNALNGCGAG
jgi:hypothetical protein